MRWLQAESAVKLPHMSCTAAKKCFCQSRSLARHVVGGGHDSEPKCKQLLLVAAAATAAAAASLMYRIILLLLLQRLQHLSHKLTRRCVGPIPARLLLTAVMRCKIVTF